MKSDGYWALVGMLSIIFMLLHAVTMAGLQLVMLSIVFMLPHVVIVAMAAAVALTFSPIRSQSDGLQLIMQREPKVIQKNMEDQP